MKKNLFKIASIVLAGSIVLTACNKKEDDPKPSPEAGAYTNASFVVCEGNFGQNDGSIDAIINGELKKDVFQAENDRPLGDVVQSMEKIGDKIFIVVNNSGKVEAVNANTFKSEGVCTGFSYPRYVANRNDNEIFVSNGNGFGEDYVYVVNKLSMQKTDSVATGFGPNTMVVSNGKLFVANSGGFSTDKRVSVINVSTLEVEKTITVGDNPYDMEVDAQGNIIVLCKGLTNYNYDNEGNYLGSEIVSNTAIYTINASSLEATATKEFDHQFASYGGNLIAYNNGTIYYVDDAVYSFANGTSTKLIDGSFYGISTSENGEIWVTETPYTSSHAAKQYDKDGKLIKTYSTSNYPNAVIF
ncbi:MAG: hypothetical protein J6X43_11520 [Bacteroidales bacterium]|nr:hypothetical protein [Bacteroidales bacterium]